MILDKDPKAAAFIFDIDGTLADTMPIHYQAWMEVCKRKGFHYPEEMFYEFAGIPTVKIVSLLNERLGLSLDVQETVKDKEAEFLKIISQVKPIQPVVDIVLRYHEKIPMSLGTGGRREMADLTMKAINLDGYFDILVASEDVEHHKPAPDTFLKCAQLMGIDPSHCQVFEDGEPGIEAAKKAGMIITDIRPFL